MSSTLPAISVGFVGGGRMAQALAQGLTNHDRPSAISFVDPDDQAAARFIQQCPAARRYTDAPSLAQASEVILLAVKPQVMREVLADLAESIGDGHLIVSVAAGIPLATYRAALDTNRVVRVMPNTPCLIGCGMSAMCCAAAVTDDDRRRVVTILGSVGEVAEVDEAEMDAVTGLSGSGPAYVFSFIEALTAGGVEQGLDEQLAHQLATQTVLGAAQLVKTTGRQPSELREQVTSPGGTTLAGLAVLAESGFEAAVRRTVAAATQRSKELAAS